VGKEVSLLAGLGKCGVCGGGVVREMNGKDGKRRAFYWCSRYRAHGRAVCSNAMRLPCDETEELILRELETHVLRPERVEEFIIEAESNAANDERRHVLEAELKDVRHARSDSSRRSRKREATPRRGSPRG
jgi:hypothetical protein